jgi:hypothetical protein
MVEKSCWLCESYLPPLKQNVSLRTVQKHDYLIRSVSFRGHACKLNKLLTQMTVAIEPTQFGNFHNCSLFLFQQLLCLVLPVAGFAFHTTVTIFQKVLGVTPYNRSYLGVRKLYSFLIRHLGSFECYLLLFYFKHFFGKRHSTKPRISGSNNIPVGCVRGSLAKVVFPTQNEAIN